MRKSIKRLAIIIISALVIGPIVAQNGSSDTAFTVKTVPNVRLEDATQYVSDPAAILSSSARDTINATLSRLERLTGIETAVVVVPSVGEQDVFAFAHSLFQTWGIGKASSDNGLLIVFVLDRREIRFVTGYGLEGYLTDALCKRIQQRYMVPEFRLGHYDEGMTAGIAAVYDTLRDTMTAESDDDDGIPVWTMIVVVAAFVAVFIVAAVLLDRRERRCSHCRRVALRRIATTKYKDKRGRRMIKESYICSHCGKTTERVRRDNDDDGGGALLNAAALGMLLGRGGGTAGSFRGPVGGSFGGGTSGGGGAASRW